MNLHTFLGIAALGLSSCTSTYDYSSSSPAPSKNESLAKVFCSIASDYRVHIHDCDDMAQEMRDEMIARGTRVSDLVLPFGLGKDDLIPHMWSERREGAEWRVYDPAMRIYSGERAKHHSRFYVLGSFSGNMTVRDMLFFAKDYAGPGSRFIDGRWIRKK